MVWTTDKLIQQVTETTSTPNSQLRFDDSAILSFADEELKYNVVPMMINARENYFIHSEVITLDGSYSYELPYRAVLNGLRSVQFFEAPNRPAKHVRPITPEDVTALYFDEPVSQIDFLIGFWLENDTIVPYPQINYGTLELKYHVRPSALVVSSECGRITNIDVNAKTVTCSSLPTGLTITDQVDLVNGKTGMLHTDFDNVVTNIDGSTCYLTTIPSRLKVGDYLCRAEETCIVPLPEEVIPLLVMSTSARLFMSQGDSEALSTLIPKLQAAEQDIQRILQPRVQTPKAKVINRNSFLRRR